MRTAPGGETTAGMVVSVAEMRAMEAAAVAGGISEAVLMEEAGAGAAAAVRQFCQGAGVALVYAGKGHNAGDAFVLAAVPHKIRRRACVARRTLPLRVHLHFENVIN